MGQVQDVEDVPGRLPLLGNAFGLGAVRQGGGVLGPLDADVLDKFRIELLGIAAALPPVQDELRDGLLDKIPVNVRALP